MVAQSLLGNLPSDAPFRAHALRIDADSRRQHSSSVNRGELAGILADEAHKLEHHDVRELMNVGVIAPHYVPSKDQPADLLTKVMTFDNLRHMLALLNILT